jgi:hypothetical protein
MAATVLTPFVPSRAGVADPTEVATDATNGNQFTNTGKTIFRIHNADGAAPHTFTVSFPAGFGPDQAVITPESNNVLTSGTNWYGKYDPKVFGSVLHILSSSTQLKITVIEP